jgi:N-acetyl-1-D-myo-inositol-2-amino-2-deoxy-alpha-D-glucopyranoside deacetylase
MQGDSMSEKVLLAVMAHPDDETFGTGGTLALYAKRGVKVYLVCATRGEVGDVDEKYMNGFHSIAEVRENELRCAAGILGLTDVFFLGYRDSGMPGSVDNSHPQALAAQPVEKVAREIAHYIRQLKPEVVITFDPIGGYRHPDHIAVHKATVLACNISSNPAMVDDGLPPYQPAKLYFNTFPRKFMRFALNVSRLFGNDPHHFGRNKDIDMLSIAEVDFPIDARIDYRSVSQIRDQAAACHASQGGGSMSTGFMGWWRRMFAAEETFMRGYPVVKNHHVEHDLYEGL